jgi:Trk K+ transport system NAD-binding subunit
MRNAKGLARARLLIRQNRLALGLLVAWFVASFVGFVALGHTPREAAQIVAFARTDASAWGTFYKNFTDMVVFGALMGVLVSEAGRKYKPEETARLFASRARGHAVLVGYTHLAERMRELLVANGVPVVVVEADRAKVDALVRAEEPVVLASGRDPSDLEAAGVGHAKMVVLAMEEIDTAAVVASHVRHQNRECELVVRCYDDDVGAVLAKTYAARIVSTSRLAAQHVAALAQKSGTNFCVIIGAQNLGLRLAQIMKDRGTRFVAVDASRAALDDLAESDPVVCGSPTDPETLAKAKVESCDLVVLTGDDLGMNMVIADRVRDVNTSCKIVCRLYHDDSAEMLTRAPFSCDVVSTSKHAVKMLADAGALRAVGIGPAEAKATVKGAVRKASA